jgi:hypothetical protein
MAGSTMASLIVRPQPVNARSVDSGDGKWAFSGDFTEAPIDLSGVDFIIQTRRNADLDRSAPSGWKRGILATSLGSFGGYLPIPRRRAAGPGVRGWFQESHFSAPRTVENPNQQYWMLARFTRSAVIPPSPSFAGFSSPLVSLKRTGATFHLSPLSGSTKWPTTTVASLR